jgi:hypothetical protein
MRADEAMMTDEAMRGLPYLKRLVDVGEEGDDAKA